MSANQTAAAQQLSSPHPTASGTFEPVSPTSPPRLQARAAPRTRPAPAWFPCRMAPSTGTGANRSLTAAAEALRLRKSPTQGVPTDGR